MLFQSAVIALFAAVAAAQVHAPTTQEGNAILLPGLNEEVPKGVAYTITWTPSSPNPVSLLLLKGPSTNVVPIATLAEGLANSGTFVWTPSEALETTGDRFYGLQIIDDVDGKFQYSTQFGLTGETIQPSSSAPVSTPGGYPTGAPSSKVHSTKVHISSSVNYTSGYPVTTSASHSVSSGYPVSGNSTIIVKPTKTPSVPATLKTTSTIETGTSPASSTTGGPPESTGAASGLKAGLGMAGVLAAAAAFL